MPGAVVGVLKWLNTVGLQQESSHMLYVTYALRTNRSSCLQHHAFKLKTRWVEKTLKLQPFFLSPQLTMFASS